MSSYVGLKKKKTRFKLQQEKERWELTLKLAKSGALNATNVEVKSFENMIKVIEREMSDLSTGKFDFFAAVGLRPTAGQKDALKEAANITLENFRSILDAQAELANAAVESAQKRVEAAQSALDKEIDSKNQGFAYNTDLKRKELAEAKKQEKEKLKMQQSINKQQEILDTITQSSSLITASANLWKSFSKNSSYRTSIGYRSNINHVGKFCNCKS